MVRACISHSPQIFAEAHESVMAARFEIAKRFIEQNLPDKNLTSETVMKKLAVSRRQMYKIFERQRGVETYIRSRRLQACNIALSNPREIRLTSEIAADYGFTDSARFCRLFREEFGYSPNEAREVRQIDRPHAKISDWLLQSSPAQL